MKLFWNKRILEDELLVKIYLSAQPFLEARGGEEHVQIVLDFASILSEVREGDGEIIVPAVMLHDVGRSAIPTNLLDNSYGPNCDPGLVRLHELKGVEIAGNILQRVGYNSVKADQILRIIDGHDTRIHSISINDEIVRDADKLWRYGPGFWLLLEKFRMQVEDALQMMLSNIDKWFFLPESKEIAREALKQRQNEAKTLSSRKRR